MKKESSAAASEVRVLKTGTCPSNSRKSKLTYQIGGASESDVRIRITGNSRAGAFSNEWVPLAALQQALSAKVFTSFALAPLFKNKSVNTPAFLLAALKNEGLVKPSEELRRRYMKANPDAFWTGIKALIKAPADANVKASPGKAPAKAPAKPMPKSRSASTK